MHKTPESVYEELSEKIKSTGKKYDTDRINKAYNMAKTAHEGQFRASGEPYILHPVSVAIILVELGMDTDCVCAALLHDVVEDTPITLEELQSDFGDDIALLVDGVTKLEKVPLSSKEEQQAENIRKMLLAMSQDIRVIIIKLADRLHNMRTLQYMVPEKQLSISLETMEIYAPIANRLGMRDIKEKLEDLAINYLDPVGCEEIKKLIATRSNGNKEVLESIIERISQRLKKYGIEPYIYGRVKSLYGIYRKVYLAGRGFDEVYDIYAVRIIVNTDIECYNILGIIHDMFTPIPTRFKDYISTPKPNMYQSLHTTVLGKEGIPFEIQIRTWNMHYTAEYGIAAHWKYKEGIKNDKLEDRLAWVRQMIEAQQESENAEDIVKNIKTDLVPDDVYAFTPNGDVKSLPAGSTVVDFAYAIHSEVGNKMIGAKVNGRMVSLDHKIETGQIIEILTTKSVTHGPSREWIKLAKTSEARSKIRSWFKKERREENVLEGKMEFDRELKRNYIHFDDIQYSELVDKLCKRYNYTHEDFYAAIGYGGVSVAKIMPQIKEEYARRIKLENERASSDDIAAIMPEKSGRSGGVIVENIDNCLVKFAQCCNPLPGDEITGFITRGHGVSVHKKDCINVINSQNDPEQAQRWVKVYWTGDIKKDYKCTLDIIAHDRTGLFTDVSLALSNMHVPIHEINARQLKNGNAIIIVTISINGVEHLKNIMHKLDKVESVISVERKGK